MGDYLKIRWGRLRYLLSAATYNEPVAILLQLHQQKHH